MHHGRSLRESLRIRTVAHTRTGWPPSGASSNDEGVRQEAATGASVANDAVGAGDAGDAGDAGSAVDLRAPAERYLDLLRRVDDRDLVERLLRSVARERGSSALVLAHLGELEERQIHLSAGYASLFVYCTLVLHYSEHAAYNRIVAARASRRFPLLFRAVAEGAVHLTAVRLLAPLFTEENHVDLIELARHRTRREVEELVVRLRPRPAAIQLVRRLPEVKTQEGSRLDDGVGSTHGSGATCEWAPATRATAVTDTTDATDVTNATDACDAADAFGPCNSDTGVVARGYDGCGIERIADAIESNGRSRLTKFDSHPLTRLGPPNRTSPLAPGLYRVQFTASDGIHARLRRAQDLLRHQIPNGDIASILDLALRLLIERIEARRLGRGARPARDRSAPARSRYIPLPLRRQIWLRDGGRCAFASEAGVRCSATALLEFHHLRAFALGGVHSPANLELRCRAHNQYEADRIFGRRLAVT